MVHGLIYLRIALKKCTNLGNFTAKGRLEDAEKALCWLRGWVGPEMVKEEFSLLKKVIQSKSSRSRMSFMDKFKWYKRRTFIIPHLLLIVTFFIGHFGGMMSVQTNAVRIQRKFCLGGWTSHHGCGFFFVG